MERALVGAAPPTHGRDQPAADEADSEVAPAQHVPSPEIAEDMLGRMPFIYCGVDLAGVCLHVRGLGLARLGLNEAETIGRNILRLFPDLRPHFDRALRGERVLFEMHGSQFGEARWFLACLVPAAGRERIHLFALDTTEFRRVESDVFRGRELIQLIHGLNQLTLSGGAPRDIMDGAVSRIRAFFPERIVGVASIDGNGSAVVESLMLGPGKPIHRSHRLAFDGRALGLLRHGRELVLGDPSRDEDRVVSRVAAALGARSLLVQPLMSSGELTGALLLYSRENLPWSPAEMDFAREIAGAVAISLSDSTARERQARIDQALRRSEERWRGLVRNTPAIIMTVDREGMVLFANRVPPGHSPDELIGMHATAIARPESSEIVTRSLQRVFAEGEPIKLDVFSYGPQDGPAWYECTLAPLLHEGQIEQAIIIAIDITERCAAEGAVRESENRYRLLAENMHDVITIRDLRTLECLYMSPSVERVRGFPLETAAAHSIEEAMAPGSEERGRAFFDDFQARALVSPPGENLESRIELEYNRKDSEPVWVDVRLSLIRDEEGRPSQILGSGRDITARRRVEAALRASEEKYRQIFHSESDAIVIFDADTLLFSEVNDAAVRMYGYSREEFARMTPMDLSAEPDETSRVVMGGLSDERPYRIPLRWHRKNTGRIFPVDLSCSPFRVGDRKFMCSILRDVSERLSAEEALRQSEENYRTLVNASMDLIVRTNEDGDYTFLNPAAQDVFRLGKNFLLFVHKDDLEASRAVWDDIAAGKPLLNFENRVIDQKGRLRYLAWSAAPYFDASGRLRGVTAVARDVTSQKKAEALIGEVGLTLREADIFRLVIRGYTNLNIATQLGIKESTVKYHLNTIFRKAGVQNRTELTALAR